MMKIMMKNLIMVLFITGLSGCQIYPSITENDLSELSNENLCRALGTYNDDGRLVLKIYDELKKRPEKIDPERCRILENKDKKQHKNNKSRENEIIKLPHINDKFPQYVAPEHHKIIHNHREKNISDLLRVYRSSIDDIGHIPQSYNINNDEDEKNRIDMKDKDMSELMKDCLKKHISNHHSNHDK